jgi:uncharacterized protein YraI
MINHFRKTGQFTIVTVLLLLLSAFGTTFAQDSNGAFRFVHAIPGVSAVDVYINGQLSATNLDFGESSNYLSVPFGEHTISVTPPGLGTTIWEQQITADSQPLTLVASNPEAPEFSAFDDDFSSLAVGSSRFSIVHAIADAPEVSITANSEQGPNLSYGQFAGTFDVPTGVYSLGVNTTDGTEIIADAPLGFATNTTYIVIVYGTAATPEIMTLSAPVAAEDGSGFVRFTHAVAGAPDVDIYADGTLIVPMLAFSQSTEHVAIPANTYNAEVRVAGTEDVVLSADLTVEAGTAASVVALGNPDEIGVTVLSDNIAGISADTALVSVINTIPGDSEVSVVLTDGTSLADGLTFGETSSVVSLSPTSQIPTVTFSLDGQSATLELPEQDFYGGVYYNVIAVNGTMFTPPTLIFESTNLAQTAGSAPDADETLVIEVSTSETTEDDTVFGNEDSATNEPVQAPTEVAQQPEVQPTQAPLPTVPVVVEEALPTARILLDPGVNLQLRQFPSAEALSLGLAPSGSTIIVNGREGAPIDLNGDEIIEEGEEAFVDPATLLTDDDDDLNPEETWVNFTYPTPDGGEVTAWTLALFLDIRTPEGELQRLADLELIPGNRAGEAVATDVTPPAIQEDRVTVEVFGLDVDANLNVRRTPDTAGEVLARIPNGTVADFIGIGESGEWAFIRLSPPEGGSITGWTASLFLQFQLNGENVTVEDLQVRNLYPTADEETDVGEISEDAPDLAVPTPDPLQDAFVATVELDPNANLNLRRTPDAQSEVVARIPSGSSVIVDGRTADGEWLETSFEGQVGWVASAFVVLTFNGDFVEVTDVPITLDDDTNDDG